MLPSSLRLPSYSDERPPGFRVDTCFVVSDKYRFIYVKLQKNAGSSIIQMLKEAFCDTRTAGTWGGPACRDTHVLWHGQLAGANYSNSDCVSIKSINASSFRDYFVFSFLREPAARAVSMVQYCAIGWHRHSSGCKACDTNGCGMCPWNHCEPQYDRLFSPSGRAYVDYLGHVETLSDDMHEVIAAVRARYFARTGETLEVYNPRNRSDVAAIRVNSDRTLAFAMRRVKTPPPLNCTPADCLALRNNATRGLYNEDLLHFGSDWGKHVD